MLNEARKNSSAASRSYLTTASVLILLLAAGLQAFAQQQPAAAERLQQTDPNYRIGVGDVLKVLVPKNQLLSSDAVRVNNSGNIRLPMIDEEIPARCMTEAELSAAVTEKYKKYLLNPQVYVTITQFNSNPVAVVGAVNAPGRFLLQRPVRLLELLTLVNGARPNAGRTVQILKTSKSQSCSESPATYASVNDIQSEEMITVPLAETMKGSEFANPLIHAGDIVRVTEAEQAYVIGNVKLAATINLNEPVTLSKAIAMAGGVTNEAEIKKIKISRQTDGLNKTELIVNLKDINERKTEDVLLQANDIVEVPGPSGAKKFFKDVFRSIIPVVTRAPIVVP